MAAAASAIKELDKEPVKGAVLWKLRTGRAYTAIELSDEADVTKSEIHSHLSVLTETGLVAEIMRRKRGYYRLLNDEVARALRNHYLNTGMTENELRENHHPQGMKYCRTCYNHLAGKVGVLLANHLRQRDIIKIGDDTHFTLGRKGEAFFKEFGIDLAVLRQKRSRFAKACIDFSERKYHLGGALGKAFFDKMGTKGWVRSVENAREVKITSHGKKAFANYFNLDV